MENSVVNAVIEAMLKNSSSQLLSGNYSQAIDESTKYLSSVQDLKPEAKKFYIPVILKLYGIRAQSYYMLWLQTNDEHLLQEAKLDQKKAYQSAEVLSQSVSYENLVALKENILNLIHEDANYRRDSLKAIIDTRFEGNTLNSESSTKAFSKFWYYIIFFLTGAIAWGIFPLIYLITRGGVSAGGSISTAVAFIIGLLFFLLFMLTLKGWNWFSQYKFGSYGSLIKYMSTLFIGITVIGLIPICYWTGKGIFRWIDKIWGREFFPTDIVS
jgi:hypothetical protein